MNNLIIVDTREKGHKSILKYFETEWEKDKFKRKIKYVKAWRLVEDSTDINFND